MVEIPTQMGTATQLGETLVWPSVNLKVISEDIIDPMLLREGIFDLSPWGALIRETEAAKPVLKARP